MWSIFFLIGAATYIACVALFAGCVVWATEGSAKRRWLFGGLVGLALILFPVWDEIAGGIYFHSLCRQEAGTQVFRTVQVGEEFVLRPGETDFNTAGKLKAKGGELDVKKLSENYQVGTSMEIVSRYFRIERHITKLYDKKNLEIIAKRVRLMHRGGGLRNTVVHVSANTCPDMGEKDIYSLVFVKGEK
jgi:hypothetical protein